MDGGERCDVDAQFVTFGCTDDDLFTPIAKDVGSKTGIGLRAIVELDTFEACDIDDGLFLPIELRNRLTIEEFAQQVTIPPDAKIDGKMSATQLEVLLMLRVIGILGSEDYLTLDVANAMAVAAPHLQARIGGVNVGSHTAAHVARRGNLEDDLTRACIAEVAAVALVLVTIPNKEIGSHGVESHEVDGIAMAHSRVVETTSVVIDSHRTIGDLVATISIDVGHSQVVIALSGIFCPLGVVGIEGPTILEFLAIPIPGSEDCTRVIATTEDSARLMTIEVAHSSQHAVAAIGIIVSPIGKVTAFGDVGLGIHGSACQTIEDRDVFGTRQDAARHGTSFTIVFAPFALGRRLLLVGSFGTAVTIVGLRITDDIALSVDGTIGSLHHHFGTTITIEVIDDERHVVGTAADIDAHIDAPEQGAIEPIAVEERRTRVAIVCIVVSIGGIPFENNLILTIAIDITHRSIVGRIEIFATIGRLAFFRTLQGNW